MIVAGVVTHEPDIDRLRENLTSVVSQVASTIIYDNGSEDRAAIEELSRDYPTVTVHFAGRKMSSSLRHVLLRGLYECLR